MLNACNLKTQVGVLGFAHIGDTPLMQRSDLSVYHALAYDRVCQREGVNKIQPLSHRELVEEH